MTIQIGSLATRYPEGSYLGLCQDFDSVMGHLNANLETFKALEDELPARVSTLISKIMHAMSEKIGSFIAESSKLETQQATRTISEIQPALTGLTKRAKKQLKVSNAVIKKFNELKGGIAGLENKIPKSTGRNRNKKSAVSARRAASEALANLINDYLEEIEESIFPKKNEKIFTRMPIFSKHQLSERAFQDQSKLDPTGIAQTFIIRDPLQARECSMRHMSKRIYVFKILLDQCAKYSTQLKKSGLSHQVSAQKVYTANGFEEVPQKDRRFYQRAHVSIMPQLQLNEKPTFDQDGQMNVKILNPKVDIRPYFSFVKDTEIELDALLNCADVAPNYINFIDDISESHDRENLFDLLDQVIQGRNVKYALKDFVYGVDSTLETLFKNLIDNKPRGQQYRSSYITPNEKRLFNTKGEMRGYIISAVLGMHEALNEVKECNGALQPL